MVEIKVMGSTPLEALSSLTAFGMHCMKNADVCAAASRILEAEKHEEKKLAATQAQADPAPAAVPGPVDGTNGQAAAPGGKPEPVPTVEQVRAKGIEASRKYGKEAVVAILQKYGVPGISAIAEKDRAAFQADLEKLGEENA